MNRGTESNVTVTSESVTTAGIAATVTAPNITNGDNNIVGALKELSESFNSFQRTIVNHLRIKYRSLL